MHIGYYTGVLSRPNKSLFNSIALLTQYFLVLRATCYYPSLCQVINIILPREAMHSAVFAVVRPSVTLVYCIETAKPTIKLFIAW